MRAAPSRAVARDCERDVDYERRRREDAAGRDGGRGGAAAWVHPRALPAAPRHAVEAELSGDLPRVVRVVGVRHVDVLVAGAGAAQAVRPHSVRSGRGHIGRFDAGVRHSRHETGQRRLVAPLRRAQVHVAPAARRAVPRARGVPPHQHGALEKRSPAADAHAVVGVGVPVVGAVPGLGEVHRLPERQLLLRRLRHVRVNPLRVGLRVVPMHAVDLDLGHGQRGLVVPAGADRVPVGVDAAQVAGGEGDPSLLRVLLVEQLPDVGLRAPPRDHEVEKALEGDALRDVLRAVGAAGVRERGLRARVVPREDLRPHRPAAAAEVAVAPAENVEPSLAVVADAFAGSIQTTDRHPGTFKPPAASQFRNRPAPTLKASDDNVDTTNCSRTSRNGPWNDRKRQLIHAVLLHAARVRAAAGLVQGRPLEPVVEAVAEAEAVEQRPIFERGAERGVGEAGAQEPLRPAHAAALPRSLQNILQRCWPKAQAAAEMLARCLRIGTECFQMSRAGQVPAPGGLALRRRGSVTRHRPAAGVQRLTEPLHVELVRVRANVENSEGPGRQVGGIDPGRRMIKTAG
eukprot:gene7695-biopygen9716